MAYHELIKDFERIRDYMREFYVYGFKSREEYDAKSGRSYDNERRRLESWLGAYMSFRRDAGGKRVFLSVDSRSIPRNPLYQAFKAKSFTAKDITLHFYILDSLADGSALAVREIADRIGGRYLSRFENVFSLDESTVRKKLKEYQTLGLLRTVRRGREVRFQRTDPFDLTSWTEALAFYSEENPLGVIGSYLLDKLDAPPDIFRFKHHYILYALDSDVLCRLLDAIRQRRTVALTIKSLRGGPDFQGTVCPLKIYRSTQTGRQYLLCRHSGHMSFFRVDAIKKLEMGNIEDRYEEYLEACNRFSRHLWGVSTGGGRRLDHLEMTIRIEDGEPYILQRLEREKRHGTIERIDSHTCKFTAEVYDAAEMLPWLRTFIGRIVDLQCSSQFVTDTFFADLERMSALYGGGDAVQ